MPERPLPYRPPELEGLGKPSRVERGRRRSGDPVPGNAVHSRGNVDTRVVDELKEVVAEAGPGPEPQDDLEGIHREYNEAYQLLEILLAEHPDVTRPTVPFNGRDISLDKALRLIDADIIQTVAQYEASEGSESDNAAALGNIKGALSEITELKEIFLTAIAKHEQLAGESFVESSKDIGHENDAEKQALSVLETDFQKWQRIRGRINELTDDTAFIAAMRSLPVPNFGKKLEQDKAESTINRWRRVLEQGKTPNDDLQSKIDALNQNLTQMIPAAEALLAQMEAQSKKGGVSSADAANPERSETEDTKGIPTKSLERADTLLARWEEVRTEVGARRLIDLLKQKYPEPKFTLPHVGWIKHRVNSVYRTSDAWVGQAAEHNQKRLAEDLEQLAGIVGDAEIIATEIRAKEAPAQENEFKDVAIIDGVARLESLFARWEELRGSYGDTELREMMFQDRGPEFPPLKDIADWLVKQSKKNKWKLQDEELLRYDALPKMAGFISRAEAAAKKLQPKTKVEKKPVPEERKDREPETGAKVIVFPSGRVVESDAERTAWEKLLPEKAKSFKEEILIRQANAFQKRIQEKLLERGIEHSVDRSRAAKAALEAFMPVRIRQIAKERNIEITDEEIERIFMVSLRKNLLVS